MFLYKDIIELLNKSIYYESDNQLILNFAYMR